eukprot:c46973_g1_i1.p3 GENE.c46973_g1_i1~~c46973_g1_i1.p3  ORF type:complete len:171 (+),score=32.96 c46973_g1_i1:591-1103(+)
MLGRIAIELVLFHPTCLLLPYPHILWESAADNDSALVTLKFGNQFVQVSLLVDSSGKLECATVVRYCSVAGVQAVRCNAVHTLCDFVTTDKGLKLPTSMVWSWRLLQGEPKTTSRMFPKKRLNVGPQHSEESGPNDSNLELLDLDRNEFSGIRYDHLRIFSAQFKHIGYL